MRCHVHGKFEYAGNDVTFTISLDALTRESAELYVQDLFLGPYSVPAIEKRIRDTDGPPDVEIINIDCEETSTDAINHQVLDDLARATHSQTRGRGSRGALRRRNALSEHPRGKEKPFRAKRLRDAW